MKESIPKYANFYECYGVESANEVDLKKWRFIGWKDNLYVFKIRESKRKE
jgi:hypothetical protein